MAEDTATNISPIGLFSSMPGTITRQALGRIAKHGDLYDAISEKFCGRSIFRQELPDPCPFISKIANPHSDISFTTVSKLTQNLQNLDVSGELKLSVMGGMCELDGSAKYLSKKKQSFQSVQCTLIYNIKTVSEHLELANSKIKDYISDEYTYPKDTYVVVGILWGASCIVTVTDENTEEEDKQTVERKLRIGVENMQMSVSASGSISTSNQNEATDESRNFKHEIFGDVLPDSSDEFPQSLDGAMILMKKVPQLIQKYNDGKGKPLTYIMLPASCVKSPTKEPEIFEGLGDVWTTKIVNVFEHITEARQRVQDQIEKVNANSYCATPNELCETRQTEDELEELDAQAKADFTRHLKEIRVGKAKAEECLKEFSNEHKQKANDILSKYSVIREAVGSRVVLRKRCEKVCAKHLRGPVEQRIASACDDYDNVYVLFHGDADHETTTRNESVFIELAKEYKIDDKTVCYFTWSHENSKDVRIKHFMNGKLVHDDVANQSETSNVAKCLSPARRVPMVPLKLRCPGSYDGECSEETVAWTCFHCNETLQFCPDYRALQCKCGHAAANQFRFRCHNCDAHGPDFKQFKGDTLKTAIDRLVSASCGGKYLVKLFTKSWLSVCSISKCASLTN